MKHCDTVKILLLNGRRTFKEGVLSKASGEPVYFLNELPLKNYENSIVTYNDITGKLSVKNIDFQSFHLVFEPI